MKRLKDIMNWELAEWGKARMEAGREKYHSIDHDRYNLLDVAEELIDAANIVKRLEHHLGEELLSRRDVELRLEHLKSSLEHALNDLAYLDRALPDEICNDEEGGDRIWWPGEKYLPSKKDSVDYDDIECWEKIANAGTDPE